MGEKELRKKKMKVTIRTGYKKGDWLIIVGNHEIWLLKKDEKDVETQRQAEIKLYDKSYRITKKSLQEQFGKGIVLALKKPNSSITFDDCGFFRKMGIT